MLTKESSAHLLIGFIIIFQFYFSSLRKDFVNKTNGFIKVYVCRLFIHPNVVKMTYAKGVDSFLHFNSLKTE